jgi:peptidoglycan/LPS O-acetylase OafA/YrhL
MAGNTRDELIARNRARAQQLRSSGPTRRPRAPVPRWRRTVSHVYAVFVVCLVLAVAGLIGGADYALGAARTVAPGVLFFAAVTATFAIAWRYSHKVAVILYVAWLAAGAVVGVMSGDQETTEALWGIGVLGLILLLFVVVLRRKQRRDASPRRKAALMKKLAHSAAAKKSSPSRASR